MFKNTFTYLAHSYYNTCPSHNKVKYLDDFKKARDPPIPTAATSFPMNLPIPINGTDKIHPNNYNFNDPTRWAAAKNAPPSNTPLQSPFKEWIKMTREITQLINNDANIFNNSYN